MKPDFLCVGAQKAATTWLYGQMKKQPQIWVPPIKELNYFNNPSTSIYKKLFSKHWLEKDWRILFKQKLIIPFSKGKLKMMRPFGWYLKYFFFPRSFSWYISLFPEDTDKRKGEFSVGYAVLSEKMVSLIHSKLPDLKIIYILRNPILRTWSQLKMNLGRHKELNLDELPEEEFLKYFNDRFMIAHNQYLANLEILKKYFCAEQIFIGFFDEIQQKPAHFLRNLFDFLGVNFKEEIFLKELNTKTNVGIKKKIPTKYLTYLADMYHQQILKIHQVFNNAYTKEWVHFSEQYKNNLPFVTNHVTKK